MKHVPNLLTIARLAAAPYLFWLVWRREYPETIVLFIAIGITDVLDGFIARRFNASSRLGAYLDPIADKLLLSGMFVMLAWTQAIDLWLAAVVLGRDVLILCAALALYVSGSRRSFPPSIWGKASTFIQILFICFRLGALAQIPVELVARMLGWAAAALAVVSLADYAKRTLQREAEVPAS